MRVILKKGSKAAAVPHPAPPGGPCPGGACSESSSAVADCPTQDCSASGVDPQLGLVLPPAPASSHQSTSDSSAVPVAAGPSPVKKRSRSPVQSSSADLDVSTKFSVESSLTSVPPSPDPSRSDQKPSVPVVHDSIASVGSNSAGANAGNRKRRHGDGGGGHVTFADQPDYLSPTAAAASIAAALAAAAQFSPPGDKKRSATNTTSSSSASESAEPESKRAKQQHRQSHSGGILRPPAGVPHQQPPSTTTSAPVPAPPSPASAATSSSTGTAEKASTNTNMGVPTRQHRLSWDNEEGNYVRSIRREDSPQEDVADEDDPVARGDNLNEQREESDDPARSSSLYDQPQQPLPLRPHNAIAIAQQPCSSWSASSSSSRGRNSRSNSPVSSGGGGGKKHSSGRPMPAFQEALKKRGLEMAEQEGDGNCLFRAVSLQVYGDPNNHAEVRKRCMDFMAKDEAHFAQFIPDEPFGEYVRRKRVIGVHGNNPEIQAISELFNRPVEIYEPENGANPINIFQGEYKTSDDPIRLSYHDGNHYNAVVDPFKPTAGLGLGLPGLKPGLADKMQLDKAKEESDKAEVDRAKKESMLAQERMYEKKAFALSDLDAADFDLEQAVMQSSLQSYMNEQGRKQSHQHHAHSHHHRGRRHQRTPSPPGHMYSSTSARNGYGASSPFASASASAAAAASRDDDMYSSSASSSAAARSSFTGAEGASAAVSAAAAASSYPSSPPHHSAAASSNSAAGGTRAGAVGGDEYPQCVQELVMNGFELPKVLRAYELVGDNFDSLLSFLMNA